VQPPPQLADCSSDEQAYRHYLDTLNALVDDASDRRNLRMLADALAWTLARIAVYCGTKATGDIVAYLGKYMIEIEERNEARRELERQREEGRRPN
jgi:hypothetical protein